MVRILGVDGFEQVLSLKGHALEGIGESDFHRDKATRTQTQGLFGVERVVCGGGICMRRAHDILKKRRDIILNLEGDFGMRAV